MRDYEKFYINGEWVDPATPNTLEVINPATEEVAGEISLGSEADVDKAVEAAKEAFKTWGKTTPEERAAVMERVLEEYKKRYDDLAAAVTEEMGAPEFLAQKAQAAMGVAHLGTALQILKDYPFEEDKGSTRVVKEPIGVVGMITPWNWPLNQITAKVAPALATGCTMVLKPSEVAPFSAYVFAEILDAAGVPKGVFNLVNGDGQGVGTALASHPDVDMVSFTGSTRAGIEVAKNAAPTVKRVQQELGGKSPNIILDDTDFAKNVAAGIGGVMQNSGQSCNAPTRMFVPKERMEEVVAIAKSTTEKFAPGAPDSGAKMGPVVSQAQFDKIQGLIKKGIDEGATVAAGGEGRPDGLDKGYYVKPTVFTDASNDMTISREEIFGPVLTVIGYDNVDQAIDMGNDTPYGLAGYVAGADHDEALRVASRLRAGQISVNNAPPDPNAPFGGFKQSGNGREWGAHAFDDFLEIKAVMGFAPTSS
ncbi:aldehyde dehydrogenase family protein [Epidermidibacterium keratini]|uniref:Aldehyde dehydrogenase family protein n=1 Tax=Epidermidibacterium keratini TaxID=1891644 RepID=A0A7L4YKF9_9ACTN|nr:aldehyde dehydrogenase family protein [Epidermidibacterium keratini]QHB99609.1 aldehyde dehydrogenase family protein [Epidermidibacterium keratini]